METQKKASEDYSPFKKGAIWADIQAHHASTDSVILICDGIVEGWDPLGGPQKYVLILRDTGDYIRALVYS